MGKPIKETMKYLALLPVCAALALGVSSCIIVVGDEGELHTHAAWSDDARGEVLRGSGVAQTQAREVPEFHAIRLRGGADVRVRIGAERGVQVTCDDNLVDKLTTVVEDGVLEIGMLEGRYRFKNQPCVVVAAQTLDAFLLEGAGDVAIEGASGTALRLEVSGAGDLRARGAVDQLTVAVSGAGDLELQDLAARVASVSVSGAGDVHVNASETLEASISGAGDVRYRGSPKLSKQVSGAGSIRQE